MKILFINAIICAFMITSVVFCQNACVLNTIEIALQKREFKKLDETSKEVIANFGKMLGGFFAMIATKDEDDNKEAFGQALHTTVDGLVDMVITGMKRNGAISTIDKNRLHELLAQIIEQFSPEMRLLLLELT